MKTKTVLSLTIIGVLLLGVVSTATQSEDIQKILTDINSDKLVMMRVLSTYETSSKVSNTMRSKVEKLYKTSKQHYKAMLAVDLEEEYSAQYRDLVLVAASWQAVMEMYHNEFSEDSPSKNRVFRITEIAMQYHTKLIEEVIKNSAG